MDLTDKSRDLERDGYIAIADLLTEQEVAWYLECYDRILSGQIDAGQWRTDLGSGQSQQREGVENITQVMWPSELIPDLLGSSAYQRALEIARQLLGDDMAFDFDMLIDKAPGSHRLPLREHRWHGRSGGALQCDGSEAECVCVPLRPGSCTFHNGGVMHYSRGNTTAGHRRALIINFRPEAMIRLEREQGFDHGKTKNVRENRIGWNVETSGVGVGDRTAWTGSR
jgi:phytanoyl-CoA hydroxylase